MAAMLKPVEWIGSSQHDLRSFPAEVRAVIGEAIYRAQKGGEHPAGKALKGFGGRGVLEVIDDHAGSTFRAVYTVRFPAAIYVLHAFQKKSKKGISTPKHEIELIRNRLRRAENHHRLVYQSGQRS
jgi:phage-related protein